MKENRIKEKTKPDLQLMFLQTRTKSTKHIHNRKMLKLLNFLAPTITKLIHVMLTNLSKSSQLRQLPTPTNRHQFRCSRYSKLHSYMLFAIDCHVNCRKQIWKFYFKHCSKLRLQSHATQQRHQHGKRINNCSCHNDHPHLYLEFKCTRFNQMSHHLWKPWTS